MRRSLLRRAETPRYEDAIALLSGDGPLESPTQEWAFGNAR